MKKGEYIAEEDIRAILRAADMIISRGGRLLVAKILKGSREKKLLELQLDACPVYGYFRTEKIETIMEKIDWMLEYGFLDIQYSKKRPMIVITEQGWEIESDQRTDELLNEWKQWAEEGSPVPDMEYLKDRNREMMMLFLEKVKMEKDERFLPFLQAWRKIEYKKVRAAIEETIQAIKTGGEMESQCLLEKKEAVSRALKGQPPQDILLKCWTCGKRFSFTIEEQRFYRQKRFNYPKRCKKCREKERQDLFW